MIQTIYRTQLGNNWTSITVVRNRVRDAIAGLNQAAREMSRSSKDAADAMQSFIQISMKVGRCDSNGNEVIESEEVVECHPSQAHVVAKQLAIQGVTWMLHQHAEQCEWLAVLLLVWELVRLSMLCGRWLSSSQSEDGKALLWTLCEGVMG